MSSTEQLRVRWFRWYLLYPRMCIAAAGYAVMAIFALGYGLAWVVGLPTAHSVVAGVLATAPVIIAVIGERVTGIKAFGVELNLAEVAALVAGDNKTVAADLSEVMGQGRVDPYADESTAGGLSRPMQDLVRTGSKLLQIDLRNGNYWWPTRLFLVAALTQDYTAVEALVFVQSATEPHFVGIASPRDVRKRLARTFSTDNYESAYRRARDGASRGTGTAALIDEIINSWPDAVDESGSKSAAVRIGSSALELWLQDGLDIHSVPNGALTPHQRFRIVSEPRRYIALTTGDHLDQVVDRDEVVTAAQMERRFGTATAGGSARGINEDRSSETREEASDE